MGTATKSTWDGRLGIEIVGKMKGCCAKAILKWRPQTIGQKTACTYCGTFLKTIRAGEVLSHLYTGWMGEEKAAAACEEPEIVIGGLFFSSEKFPTQQTVKNWMAEREINSDSVIEIDDHAFYVPLERIIPESVRAVWVAPGVVGEIGVAKQVATGGGQASMSSPGITVASMASGGLLYPAQGPAAIVAGGGSGVLHGMTDEQDGHRHEYDLVPFEDGSGPMVRGFTTYESGHSHMIEASLDGSRFDALTAPDQAPVGGHAHSHRVSHPSSPTGLTLKEKEDEDKEEEDNPPCPGSKIRSEGEGRGTGFGGGKGPIGVPLGKKVKIRGGDLALLNQAAKSLKMFHDNITGERSATADFQTQLSAAIERARGTGGMSGEVEMDEEDMNWLKEASEFIEGLSDSLTKGLNSPFEVSPATEKAWGKGDVVNPAEAGKYKGWNLGDLKAAYNALKESGPHKAGSAEAGKMKEIAFAIRAKTGWGKVK